jgi:hypothetical protein
MVVRKSERCDFERIWEIYSYAREFMKKSGNPSQWGDNRPSRATVEKDIENGVSYVIENGGEICGVFAFIIGEEPTYRHIENGCWLNDEAYGTIHRLASDGEVKGVFSVCLNFCENLIDNIKADTHTDNLIMQHLLEKFGYVKCGTIYVDDGSARIAYQKIR